MIIFAYIFGSLILLYAGLFVYKTKTGSPYVPSSDEHIKRLMKYVKKGMRVADLGCGDGRVLVEAIKQGARSGDGWEIEPLVWLKAKQEVRREKLDSRVRIYLGDMWGADLSKYNLIFVYQLTRFAKRFREKILREAKKGTIIVANTYPIPGLPHPTRNGALWVYEL